MNIKIAAFVFFAPIAAFAQIIKVPPVRTVSTLGACTDGSPKIVAVTDGSSSSDCSVGGGAYDVNCYCLNGSWSASAAASGTVTSVAATVPAALLSVAGSPITDSGTIALSLASWNANCVFAGPSSGSAATGTCRALVSDDIPSLSESKITNLVSDLAGKADSSHSHPAADIASGTIATARLGSGIADSTTYLRGDQVWASAGVTDPLVIGDLEIGTIAVGKGIAAYGYSSPYVRLYGAGDELWLRSSSLQLISGAGRYGQLTHDAIGIGKDTAIAFYNHADPVQGVIDTALVRDSAGVFAARFGTTQQGISVYNTYTDNSNYERLKISGVSGTSFTITAETAGTGIDDLDILITAAGAGVVNINRMRIGSSGVIREVYGDIYLDSGSFHTGSSTGFQAGAAVHVAYPEIEMERRIQLSWGSDYDYISAKDLGIKRNAAGILEVNGGNTSTGAAIFVRPLESPPATCDAAAEGMEYSDTSHAKCWCDGTTWTKLAGAGTCA